MSLAITREVAEILRDPVTLGPLTREQLHPTSSYLSLKPGQHTAKNRGELSFAVEGYTEPDGDSYVDRLPHVNHPHIRDEDIVVDIGCGPRGFLDGLPGHHVFVDDILAEYVEHLDSTYEGVAIHARTELLPFANSSIDVIYSINMIDHVDDMAATCQELARVLKPTGVIILQTYFNSHPLLTTEPGVFDRYFFDHIVTPLFEADEVVTHCVQSPTISDYYTMGILTCRLRVRTDAPPRSIDRALLAEQISAQSLISEVLTALAESRPTDARRHLDLLAPTELNEFHRLLLEARVSLADGDLQGGRDYLRRAREHPRGRRNPFARVAMMEIDVERLAKSIGTAQNRIGELSEVVTARGERIHELDAAVASRDKRIFELEEAVARRSERIEDLDAAVLKRSERVAELERAVVQRSARINELESAVQQRSQRIAELDAAIAGRDKRIASLTTRR